MGRKDAEERNWLMPRLIASAVMAVLLMTVSAPPGGVMPAVAQTPEVEVAAVTGTVIVDDLVDGFRRTGSGWRSARGGYDGHHYWTPASRKLNRVGIWSATLGEPGLYRVLAKLPAVHASTRKAVYKLKTASGWATRVRSQAAYRGRWVNLGTYAFTTQAEVRLSGKTLDRRGTRLMVAFDALKFVPVEPPDPPVITRLDVDPRHDRAIVTFSLAEAGPAKTEYREAGNSAWTVGSGEQSSRYADHRQVITGLMAETAYELRVVATNLGGETVSPITRFRTTALPAPVISKIDVVPAETRAVVTFSLDAKGPASIEYRRAGTTPWLAGPSETSSKYVYHRQVITDLRPETDYELRIRATNAGGTTTSRIVPFKTRQRTVACGQGDDLAQAIADARSGDTLRIRGACYFETSVTLRTDLTFVGITADASINGQSGITIGGNTHVSLVDLGFWADGFRNDGHLVMEGVAIRSEDGLNNGFDATMTLRETRVHGYYGAQNWGTLTAVDSSLSARGTTGGPGLWNHEGAVATLRGTTFGSEGAAGVANDGTATLQDVSLSNYFGLYEGSIRNSGVMAIEGSTFSDSIKDGDRGASVLSNSGVATVTDSAFLRNEGGLGAIVNSGDITLTRVTFSGNVPAGCVGC